MGDMEMNTDLLVIGAGPGGYGAAFRGAELGLDVTMVDPFLRPGGVCLHEGCIPSKSYLHLAKLILDARRAEKMGINFGTPAIDLKTMRTWKNQVIDSIADGLLKLARRRGVQLIQGKARFENSNTVRLEEAEISRIRFKYAIIATGSRPLELPGVSFIPGGRIMDSAAALLLTDIPTSLLVVGGGYVELELGSLYAALGSRVTLVERENQLLTGVDPDLLPPLQQRLSELFENILLETCIKCADANEGTVAVSLEKNGKRQQYSFDRLLISIGRIPNSDDLGLEHLNVNLDDQGFLRINDRQQTAEEHIFAVGDVAGGAMLAHKATREGRVAAEVICGLRSTFDVSAIPAVVYTDPQIGWCGLTELQASAENIPVSVQKFPWKYSGRAQTMGMASGFTKLLSDPESGRVLGVGITGPDSETLISEAALAIEMGALAEDLALTLHPHPTLSETLAEAAEMFLSTK